MPSSECDGHTLCGMFIKMTGTNPIIVRWNPDLTDCRSCLARMRRHPQLYNLLKRKHQPGLFDKEGEQSDG